MPGKLTLLGAALAVIGLVVAGGVYLTGASGVAPSGAQTTVLVARQAIAYRQVVTAADLVSKQIYTIDVPTGAYTQAGDLKTNGSVAALNIPVGTVITASAMVQSADALISLQVPSFLPISPGYVAMTIPTGEEVGVAGYIQPGDYITLVSTHGTVTRTVYTQIHVIRIGLATFGSASSAPAPTNVASSLTIVVTQCQSEYLIWLMANTQMRYNLESSSDYTGMADKDPSCPTIASAGGVTAKDVAAKWPGLA